MIISRVLIKLVFFSVRAQSDARLLWKGFCYHFKVEMFHTANEHSTMAKQQDQPRTCMREGPIDAFPGACFSQKHKLWNIISNSSLDTAQTIQEAYKGISNHDLCRGLPSKFLNQQKYVTLFSTSTMTRYFWIHSRFTQEWMTRDLRMYCSILGKQDSKKREDKLYPEYKITLQIGNLSWVIPIIDFPTKSRVSCCSRNGKFEETVGHNARW